jgi:hypothetical protein
MDWVTWSLLEAVMSYSYYSWYLVRGSGVFEYRVQLYDTCIVV